MSSVYFRFAARRSDELQRSPLLEKLVARATHAAQVADWRAAAFRVLAPGAPLPSVAAALLHAGAGGAEAEPMPGSWVCVATPVHLSAGMSSVTLPGDGILHLHAGEAQALAADFNRVFDGAQARLWVSRSAKLLCGFEQPMEVVTHDPEAMAGGDVFAFQPVGPGAPGLRRLMSEIEMWLFDHAVNRARAAAAQPPITGLWLWGGGPKGEAVPAVRGWTAGDDPFFAAFGGEPEWPLAAGAGVVVCAEQPGADDWTQVERRWLGPAAAALRAGRIKRLDLSAANRCFSIGSAGHLKFWRRARPWWESYGIQ